MKLAEKIINNLSEGKEPEGIKSIWDNGESGDRFTIIFDDKWSGYDAHKKQGGVKKNLYMALGMSDGGRGFSQFTDAEEGKHLGKKLKWSDLSKESQKHIISRMKD